MKAIVTTLIIAAVLSTSQLYAQYQLNWQQTWNSADNNLDSLGLIAVDEGANVYVAGYTRGGASLSLDILLLKYDPSGNLLWQRTYDGTAQGNDMPYDMALDGHGNIIITGTSATDGDNDYELLVLKYNSAGSLDWVRTVDTSSQYWDAGSKVAVDGSNNVVIAGVSQPGADPSMHEIVLLRFDDQGVPLNSYIGPNWASTEIHDLDLDRSGDIYLAFQKEGTWHAGTFHITPWNDFWSLEGNMNPSGIRDELVDNSGQWLRLGYQRPFFTDSTFNDIVLLSEDTLLNWLFYVAPYAGGSDDEGVKLAEDSIGNIYVAGFRTDTNGITGEDPVLIKYDGSGNLLWSRVRPGTGYANERPTGLVVTHDGRAFMSGHFGNGGAPAFGVWAVSADGTSDWTDVLSGTGEHGAEGIALTGDGCFAATGFACTSTDPASMDAVTRNYCDILQSVADHTTTAIGIAPNPFTDGVTISWPSVGNALLRYELFDGGGRSIVSGSIMNGTFIDLADLDAGAYALRCTDLSGRVRSGWLVRSR